MSEGLAPIEAAERRAGESLAKRAKAKRTPGAPDEAREGKADGGEGILTAHDGGGDSGHASPWRPPLHAPAPWLGSENGQNGV